MINRCLPVFKTEPGAQTCKGWSAAGAGGAASGSAYADLLGVVCMDLGIVATLPDLRDADGWEEWFATNVVQKSCTCPSSSLNHTQMNAVRASITGAVQVSAC